jgi:ribosome hibernation promoting factor
MKIHLTCRHTQLSAEERGILDARLTRLARLMDDGAEVHVVLSEEKHRHEAEIVLSGPDGHFAGAAVASDTRTSFLLAIDKLQKQLNRERRRRADRRLRAARHSRERQRRAGAAARGGPPPARPRAIGILRETTAAATQSLEEAAMDLLSGEEPFRVFRNVESGRMSVVYRRKDGRVGLIEAE